VKQRFLAADLDRFRLLIAGRLGLAFDESRQDMLSNVLMQRAEAARCVSAVQYLEFVMSGRMGEAELHALATLLTVTETYFFRDDDQLRAFTESALPERIRAHAADRTLRLLSAGCASGEEPYTLAILLKDRFPQLEGWDLQILGLDLNPVMIQKARTARYQTWSLRNTSKEVKEKYFRREGADSVLREDIRSMVEFEERNLAIGDPCLAGPFDVVFCRNCLMYLVPECARRVIGRLAQALSPEGFLFLGSAESTRGLSDAFRLRSTHEAFYYQKSVGADSEADREIVAPRAAADPAPEWGDSSWMDVVRIASERINVLLRDAKPASAEPSGTDAAKPNLDLALEHLRQEKFREALELLDGFCATVHDPHVELLRAGLLTQCGDLPAAEIVCRRILAADDLNTGAHYLAALCREGAGDLVGAAEHDRAAIFLDGSFAMPHLHLGRMAKRAADPATARRELETAALLLAREDSSRILLFGGGFSREALVAVSRGELNGCGGVA